MVETQARRDRQFTEERITKVEDYGDQWAISADIGTLLIPKYSATPQVGAVARYYGRWFGYPVRGVAINGVEVYYYTEKDYEAKERLKQDARNMQRRAEYAEKQGEFTARISALPGPCQKRLFQFRERNPDFGWNFEGYELACSEMAAAVARACENREGKSVDEWFEWFMEASWDVQAGIFGDAAEGASGNMASFAIRQAYFLATDPSLVPMDHGALCALVGCDGFKACDAYWKKHA